MSAQDQPTGDERLMGRLVELGVKHDETVQRVDELFTKLRELDRVLRRAAPQWWEKRI